MVLSDMTELIGKVVKFSVTKTTMPLKIARYYNFGAIWLENNAWNVLVHLLMMLFQMVASREELARCFRSFCADPLVLPEVILVRIFVTA
jgi:hypothetical protein